MKYTGTLRKVRIESIREIAKGVFVLEYKRFFEFEAGQIISIALGEQEEPRLYSIASGEKDERIQVLFNVVSEGKLTPALAHLTTGDYIWSSEGFGRFTGTDGPAVWIAQGTGIAPFSSMFRSGQVQGKMLIHGGRYADSFYYADEFLPVLGDRYVRCCSREQVSGAFHGRVTDYLSQLETLPTGAMYYLCGSSEMVVETRDILISKGVPFQKIVGEIYF